MKKVFKFLKQNIVAIIIWGVIIGGTSALAATISSGSVEYTKANGNVTTVESAINELYQAASTALSLNVYDLGEGTSFDIKTLVPSVDYTKLTVDNFRVEPVNKSGSINLSGSAGDDHTASCSSSGTVSLRLNKSYSNGVLTSSVTSSGSTSCCAEKGCSRESASASTSVTASVHAYLIIS